EDGRACRWAWRRDLGEAAKYPDRTRAGGRSRLRGIAYGVALLDRPQRPAQGANYGRTTGPHEVRPGTAVSGLPPDFGGLSLQSFRSVWLADPEARPQQTGKAQLTGN